jgi:serine/threonine protein kinase
MLIGSGDFRSPLSSNIMLIDFGLARAWKNFCGAHIEQEKGVAFSGNMMFASPNALNGFSLSRRDDLISLSYILIYLFDGEQKWMQKNKKQK